ncbi:Zinc finger protein 407 [Plakobranchus ocellatus]|uniref:Zinc finger protein 407 n=1 Tax=Plakobranchus ocellatus TaxID=259542 RepID=A0AAV4B390_9GAST|nr:Zinc finger protein 407 [Plakobranchus ocellatus]
MEKWSINTLYYGSLAVGALCLAVEPRRWAMCNGYDNIGFPLTHDKHVQPGNHGVWMPGLGCPVQGCSAKIIRQATSLKMHWAEKHEKIVAKYYCSNCVWRSQSQDLLPDPINNVWVPGQACTVKGCGARGIRLLSDLRRHWREKHEEIVPMFHCSACAYISKRKSNIFNHFRRQHRHRLQDTCSNEECIGETNYQHNQEFIDPYPLTLDIMLGKKTMNTE